jgi:hypothetical protein
MVTKMAMKKTMTLFTPLLKHSTNEKGDRRLATRQRIVLITKVTIAIVATMMMTFLAKLII